MHNEKYSDYMQHDIELSEFNCFFMKVKHVVLFLYVAYIIGYAFIFFLDHSTLHFEHWLFLFIVMYFTNVITISSIKRFAKNTIYAVVIVLIAMFFYVSRESSYTLDSVLKVINNLMLDMHELVLNAYFYIFIFISILYFIIRYCSEASFTRLNKENLYEDREKDKESIVRFLKDEDRFNVLGIDEGFGVGKTFVVDYALKELDSAKYEIIKIRCLLLDKEDIYPYIIKQLNRVLINNLIFEGHLEKLKASVIRNFDSKYLGLFSLFLRESNIDDIENFKQAIFKLNKTIVLVFDDIDRSSNYEKIEKIFSFIDDFSKNNIKSLVLFGSLNLKSINQTYSRNYIEKYIPLIMNLTPINLKKILEQEIDLANLDRKYFLFLIAIFFDNLVYKGDKQKYKELSFFYDFQSITSLNITFNDSALNINARNLKNFIEEVRFYLKGNLVIDNKFIIAYVFCKVFLYEDFYEKIDNSFDTFENVFPIHIKLLQANISLTLEEFDILYSLSHRDDVNLQNMFQFHFIDLGVKGILLTQGHEDNSNHINYYLNKLGLPILRDFSPESVIKSLDNIKSILQTNTKQLELTSSNITNMLIYTIFNYEMIAYKNKSKVVENHEAIINAIKKLKFIGNKDQLSRYKLYYDRLVKCLQLPTIKERNDSYITLIQDCINESNGMHSVFSLKDRSDVKSMLILDVFDDLQNQEILFDLILYRNNDYITDDYINAFINCRRSNLKIADFIISKFVKNEFSIKDGATLSNIRFNIIKFTIRESSIFFIENYKDYKISNKYFYTEYKKNLEHILSCNSIYCNDIISKSEKIRAHLSIVINFLDKLLVLEDYNLQVRPLFDISVTSSLSEEYKQIENLADDNERVQFIEKLYLDQGVTLDHINRLFSVSKK